LQFLAGKRGEFFAVAKTKMPCDVGAFETGQGAHSNVVKLGEQKCVDEMTAIDREFRVIDRFLRDLQARRART